MEKINYILNGVQRSAALGLSILEAATEAGVEIPTLCFLKECGAAAACQICLVSVKGKADLVPACAAKLQEGMEIQTDTPEVIEGRKKALEKICLKHRFACEFCSRYTDCELYRMMIQFNIDENSLQNGKKLQREEIGTDNAYLLQDHSKCIRCRRCVNMCEKVQLVGAITYKKEERGGTSRFYPTLSESSCLHCGQCITACPTGALSEQKETREVWNAFHDKDRYVAAVLSPYVAAAFSEKLYFKKSENTDRGKLFTALRKMGFDAVYDGTIGMAIAAEKLQTCLLDLQKTLVYSQCPAIQRLCASDYADVSLQGPNESVDFAKKCRAEAQKAAGEKEVFLVSIVPCIADKEEHTGGIYDAVITTNELVSMWNRACISRFTARTLWKDMKVGVSDSISGISGTNYKIAAYGGVLPMLQEHYEYRIAYATGIQNAKKLLDQIKNEEAKYDIIEIMACPGGCIQGGGQPRLHGNVRNSTGIEHRLIGLHDCNINIKMEGKNDIY